MDIIVAQVSSVAHVAKKTTETVPIVVLSIVEPGGRGLVASLNRPGGSITGFLYDGEAEITGKRIQLLKDIVPKLKTLAILGNPDAAGFKAYIDIYDGIGRALGVRLKLAPVRGALGPPEFEAAFSEVIRMTPEALFVISGWPTTVANQQRVVNFAARVKLPAAYTVESYVTEHGGLMAHVPSTQERLRLAAVYVDRILKGARPADLPVQAPTKFALVINAKTAKALSLTIPPSLLLQADQVIE